MCVNISTNLFLTRQQALGTNKHFPSFETFVTNILYLSSHYPENFELVSCSFKAYCKLHRLAFTRLFSLMYTFLMEFFTVASLLLVFYYFMDFNCYFSCGNLYFNFIEDPPENQSFVLASESNLSLATGLAS